MTENSIYAQFLSSSRNAKARTETVNALRHLAMDSIAFDTKDDSQYMAVYERVMRQIESAFPLLSWEVKRQMAKKNRRQMRKAHEKRQDIVHF